jgi:hypothetical protein
MREPTIREDILDNAKDLITGDRHEAYGDFGDQMKAVSSMASAAAGKAFTPRDIALILMCLKLRRMMTAEGVDSEVDMCGYAALFAEYFKDPTCK